MCANDTQVGRLRGKRARGAGSFSNVNRGLLLRATATCAVLFAGLTNSPLSRALDRPAEARSGALPPAPRGARYYVSPAGDDLAQGTLERPFRTVARGLIVLRPGDVLYIRRGIYAENLVDKIPSGTAGAPVKLSAYPEEAVVLQPGKGNYVVRIQGPRSYITLDGLTLDGRGTASANVWINTLVTGTPSHIRLQNCEITNAGTQGVLVESLPGYPTPDYNQFIKLRVHDNGKTDLHHGLYIQSSHNLVDGCEVFRNAGFGLQVYKSSGKSGTDAGHNTVRNSRFHDNGRIGGRGVGIGIYVGADNAIYNNLVWKNQTGISVGYGATNTGIFHNDVYANGGMGGINVGYTAGARNTIIQNNIIYKNAKGDIRDFGTGTIADHNTLNATDPRFRDAARQDFRLVAGSPAVDAGITLAAVRSDADGVPRPQGRAYDIGAYERR